jgi:hypothetical protein
LFRSLRQFAQGGVILLVTINRCLRVRRFERLFEQTDLASNPRDEPVEHLHVVYRLFDNFLVGRRTVETSLSMSVVLAEGQEFFMELLERLEPCQPFIYRDLSQRSTFTSREFE